MNRNQKRLHVFFVACASLIILAFGLFWFQPSHLSNNFDGRAHLFDVVLFLVVSYIIWLPIIMKVLLWSVASHIRPKIPYNAPEPNKKVAFVTTFVPASESTSLLHRILPAMTAVKYPHDTWLLDEGGSDEVRQICEQYGAKYFSRAGIDEYNQQDGKYARKTKGGNHNSWYETAGNNYDYVAQMDTDFVPHKDFLLRTLGFFAIQQLHL